MSGLPAGLHGRRRCRPADADAVTAVLGRVRGARRRAAEIVAADLVAIFGRPSLNVARDTVGVRDAGALVGVGDAARRPDRRSCTCCPRTAPRHRHGADALVAGRGPRGRRAPSPRRRSRSTNTAAITLLERDGYDAALGRRGCSRSRSSASRRPRRSPTGYAIRDFVRRTRRACRLRGDRAGVLGVARARRAAVRRLGGDRRSAAPASRPALLGLAARRGEVVGAVLVIEDDDEGWVDQLAVAREHRGRGLGARAADARVRRDVAPRRPPLRPRRRTRGPARAGSTSTSGCACARRTASTRSRSEPAPRAAGCARLRAWRRRTPSGCCSWR